MGEQPKSKIQLKAEEAIRHSEGDENLALKTLEDWVGGNPSLQDSVLKRALRRELGDASQRLRAEPSNALLVPNRSLLTPSSANIAASGWSQGAEARRRPPREALW